MRQPALGRIHERITAIATTSFPAYVIRGENESLMIDSGVNLLGPTYLAALKDVFGDAEEPDYLFFTHSHYDHVGAGGYLKRHLPGLKLGGHERLAVLAQKASALETMNRLSRDHLELLEHNRTGEDVTIYPFQVDVVLKEGDEIDLGGLTCRVYEVPGHTRDSLAYYLPEIEALFPGDACGVLRTSRGEPLQVEFVASYQDYIDSLKKMIGLQPRMICLAHNWVLTDSDAGRFLQWSLAETYRYRELIEAHLEAAHGDVEVALDEIMRAAYDADDESLPPRAAYLANLSAQVRHIARQRDNEENNQ